MLDTIPEVVDDRRRSATAPVENATLCVGHGEVLCFNGEILYE